MPRDISGVFTLDPGYLAVDGEPILPSQHNPPLQDIATGLTQSLARTGVGGMLDVLPMNNNKITMLTAGTAPDEGVNLGQMGAAITAAVDTLEDALVAQIAALATPPGSVSYFARQTVPTGWLECNGALVSRTTYANLYNVIGTVYGVGDGSTTFALPDLRGEFIRGLDSGRGVDTGRVIGSAQADAFKSHNHGGVTNSTGDHYHIDGAGTNLGGRYGTTNTGDTEFYANGSGSQTIGAHTSTTGAHSHIITADGGTETRPRNVALLICIKT